MKINWDRLFKAAMATLISMLLVWIIFCIYFMLSIMHFKMILGFFSPIIGIVVYYGIFTLVDRYAK